MRSQFYYDVDLLSAMQKFYIKSLVRQEPTYV
jgi:hypothetical protein